MAAPAIIPVTTPDELPIEATAELPLHVPPPAECDKVMSAPTQTAPAPVIAASAALTVTVVVA